jgi:tripartite-type tricarboxylate transporter receptor subunit TctC
MLFQMRRHKFITLLGAVVISLAAIASVSAQVYPSRPITMVVPFPAGGPTDAIARIVAEGMRKSLGQPIIVENASGAGGSIGVGRVARAAPDGYSLSIGQWTSHVGASAVYPVQYDVLNDFDPVSLLSDAPLWIIARNTYPATDLKELVASIKAAPGKVSAATLGPGSGSHLGGIYFQNQTGARLQFVPYRGGAPAHQDLVAAQVDLMCDLIGSSLSLVRSGRLKAYGVMAKTRWFAAPDVPTVDEMGIAGLYMSLWHALWVPKSTPQAIISKLNAAVVDALADPAVRQRFADVGQEVFPGEQQTPEALRARHKAEIEKWWPIIKAANIKAE